MQILKLLHLGVAFALEVCALSALIYWGFGLDAPFAVRILAGVGVPAVVIAIWSVYAAPASHTQLAMPWLAVLHLVVFGLAAGALVLAGKPTWGLALVVVAVANELIALLWHAQK